MAAFSVVSEFPEHAHGRQDGKPVIHGFLEDQRLGVFVLDVEVDAAFVFPVQGIGHLEEGDPKELGELCGNLAKRLPHMDIWGG